MNDFQLYFHEISKNFRVLVDGNVHPLLCGLNNITEASDAVKKLFPEFSSFSNVILGGDYYTSGDVSAKVNMIRELEHALSVIKGIPDAMIEDMALEVDIKFGANTAVDKYTNAPR